MRLESEVLSHCNGNGCRPVFFYLYLDLSHLYTILPRPLSCQVSDRGFPCLSQSLHDLDLAVPDNHYHYNEITPRIQAASDIVTPTYNVKHSPGWKGTNQNELRYMEVANPWFAVIALTQGRNHRLQADNSVSVSNFKWTRMQQKAMRKLKGQYVVNENGRYIYKSYTRNNNFCLDMFYECPALKIVVLPNGIQPNGNVYVAGSPIKYY